METNEGHVKKFKNNGRTAVIKYQHDAEYGYRMI